MGDLLVRDVEDIVVHRLKRNAELNQRSLQQELKEAVRHAAKLDPGQRRRLSERYLSQFEGPVDLDLTQLVKSGRD